MGFSEEAGLPESSVRLLFFARCRELAGCEELEVPLASPIALGELMETLRLRVPALQALPPGVAIAVNRRVAGPSRTVTPGDEVAFLPPVAGG